MKNKQVLIESLITETGSVFTSSENYQNFAANLAIGTAATVIIESSANGSTGWSTLCTFTLDTVNQEIRTGLVRVSDAYVRARVTTLTGGSARVFAWMGT